MVGVEIAVLGLDCFRADLIVLAAGIAGRRDDFVEGLRAQRIDSVYAEPEFPPSRADVEAAGERCDFSTQISPVIVRLVQVRG